MQWWDQVEIKLAGSWETSAAAAEAEEDGVEKWRRGQKGRLIGQGTINNTSSKFNHLRTEYGVYLDYMQGVEHHRPIMRM